VPSSIATWRAETSHPHGTRAGSARVTPSFACSKALNSTHARAGDLSIAVTAAIAPPAQSARAHDRWRRLRAGSMIDPARVDRRGRCAGGPNRPPRRAREPALSAGAK